MCLFREADFNPQVATVPLTVKALARSRVSVAAALSKPAKNYRQKMGGCTRAPSTCGKMSLIPKRTKVASDVDVKGLVNSVEEVRVAGVDNIPEGSRL